MYDEWRYNGYISLNKTSESRLCWIRRLGFTVLQIGLSELSIVRVGAREES